MKKYKIPAEVQREDRIFGPITMRRLIILVLGGGITYIIWINLQHSGIAIWGPPVFLLGSLTIAFAFVEPFGMRFSKFIIRMIEYFFLPRRRVWDKRFSQVAKFEFYKSEHRQWKRKNSKEIPKEDILSKKQSQRKKVYDLENILDLDLKR